MGVLDVAHVVGSKLWSNHPETWVPPQTYYDMTIQSAVLECVQQHGEIERRALDRALPQFKPSQIEGALTHLIPAGKVERENGVIRIPGNVPTGEPATPDPEGDAVADEPESDLAGADEPPADESPAEVSFDSVRRDLDTLERQASAPVGIEDLQLKRDTIEKLVEWIHPTVATVLERIDADLVRAAGGDVE